jgi:uncharacterized delta-60 repeat protein
VKNLSALKLTALEDRLAPAAAGSLDPTFGTSGRTQIPFNLGGTNLDDGRAVAVQPDGNIVIAGSVATIGGTYFGVVRLQTNGQLDTTFSGSGKAIIAFGGMGVNAVANSVTLQKDNKILIAGSTDSASNDFAITRLNTDGTQDSAFGTAGKVVIPFDLGGGNDDLLNAVAVQADGKIILVGSVESTNGFDVAVVRLNTNGSLDTTFNVTGKLLIPFDQGRTNNDFGNGVTIQADGKILVVGSADTPTGSDLAIARINTDGSYDNTFDADGKRVYGFNLGGTNDDVAKSVALQSTGKIIVSGVANALGRSSMAAVRFNTDGSVDTTFGTSGATTINFNASGSNLASANSMAISGDDSITLGGTIAPGTNADFALARLNSAGVLDAKFGTKGLTTVAFQNGGGRNNDVGNAIALQSNGRIVIVGTMETGGSNFQGDIAVARLLGTPPTPQPILAGGVANGTARILNPGSGQYITGDTLSFFPASTNVVRTATADINGDGIADYLGVPGPGASSRLVIIDGKTRAMIVDFLVFENAFTGGMYVAATDLNNDGRADVVVTPDQGGGPVAAIYDGVKLAAGVTGDSAQIIRFFGIEDPAFRGGARPSMGDLNADGVPELVVAAGFGGGPRVTIWDGASVVARAPKSLDNFFAFEPTLRNGAFVSVGDVNGDGIADLAFGGGPGGAPRVRIWDIKGNVGVAHKTEVDGSSILGTQLVNFFSGETTSRGGARVSLNDVDGDGQADLAVGSGTGDPTRIRMFNATNLLGNSSPTPNQDFDPFSTTTATGVFVG